MYGSTMVDVRTAVSQEPIPLNYGPWHSISATGRSLIDSLLTVRSTSYRITMSSIDSLHPLSTIILLFRMLILTLVIRYGLPPQSDVLLFVFLLLLMALD